MTTPAGTAGSHADGAGQGNSTQTGPMPVSPPATGGNDSRSSEPPFLQWTPRDRWFLAVISLVILAALVVQFVRLSGWGLKPLEFQRPASRQYQFQIDINTATWVEWMQLDGVGETTARKIVADREKNGPFQSIEDVQRVSGIGPATLEKMRPWLTIRKVADDEPK